MTNHMRSYGMFHITAVCSDASGYRQLEDQQTGLSSFLKSLLHPHHPNTIFMVAQTGAQAMARFGNMQFAAISLTADDEKKFTEWLSSNSLSGVEALLEFLQGGFKISCSYIVDQSAFCLTVIGTESTKLHRDMCMTSWSDDLEEAALIAYYKHVVLCSSGEWPLRQNGQRWG